MAGSSPPRAGAAAPIFVPSSVAPIAEHQPPAVSTGMGEAATPAPDEHSAGARHSTFAKGELMSTLSVWRFDTPAGADDAVGTLENLAQQHLITVLDAATVSWQPGAKKPRTRQVNDLIEVGALGGAFWGMLFGLLFLMPLLGAAIGAAAGALTGRLTDIGINDDFIKGVRDEIRPGTSALFVLSKDAVLDRVREAFAGQRAELLFTNLSAEQEARLHDAFADDALAR
jgi:uncharacterized membrane protein